MGKQFNVHPNQVLRVMLSHEFVDLLALPTIKKGTILYHGAFFKFDKFPRDSKEFFLDAPKTKITTYKGAWFSLNAASSEMYPVNNIMKLNKYKHKMNSVDLTLSVYKVKEDIPMMLNIGLFKRFATKSKKKTKKELEPEHVSVKQLHSYIKSLIERNKIGMCDEYETLLKQINETKFAETNFYLAAAICKCLEGINGWVHLDDSEEVFVCEPEKYLEFVEKHHMASFGAFDLNRESLGTMIGAKNRDIEDFIVLKTMFGSPISYQDGYQKPPALKRKELLKVVY